MRYCWLVLIACASAAGAEPIALPTRPPLVLKSTGKLNSKGAGIECSGIVRSRSRADVFWTINDSGNDPRIYPVRRDGQDAGPKTGVLIDGAKNVDWEDVTTDDDGHLIIADVGNNANRRRDLVLYYIDEPAASTQHVPLVKTVRLRYPDQGSFPAPAKDFNYDCEAVFTVKNTVHVLTKHRSDAWTKLYRLNAAEPNDDNLLIFVDRFQAGGMVTGANASADGLKLAMITYVSVWLFERDSLDTPFFEGRVSWAPFVSAQMEAVCFADDETLLLADEKLAQVYEVKLRELTCVK
jgi:hypothetical protein